jgi:two-component system response regulator NreC
MQPIRILICDDHGILRAGLSAMVGSQADMEVVGLAASADDAIRAAAETKPDVVILDVEMPGRSGLEAMPRIHEACPTARLLMLTMHDDPALVRKSLDLGASGFVVKEALGDDLVAAIRSVHQGRTYINVSLPEEGKPGAAESLAPRGDRGGASRLSEREHQVLEMLAQGFTNSEIGTRLQLSPRTIGTYRGRINEKLGLRTRADIVQYALDSGLLARS